MEAEEGLTHVLGMSLKPLLGQFLPQHPWMVVDLHDCKNTAIRDPALLVNPLSLREGVILQVVTLIHNEQVAQGPNRPHHLGEEGLQHLWRDVGQPEREKYAAVVSLRFHSNRSACA